MCGKGKRAEDLISANLNLSSKTTTTEVPPTIFEAGSLYGLHVGPTEVVQVSLFDVVRAHEKGGVAVLEPNLFASIQSHSVQPRVSAVEGHFLQWESETKF